LPKDFEEDYLVISLCLVRKSSYFYCIKLSIYCRTRLDLVLSSDIDTLIWSWTWVSQTVSWHCL